MAFNYHTEYQKYRRYFVDLGRAYRTQPQVKLYFELTITLIAISIFVTFAIRPTLLTIIGLVQDIKADQQLETQLDQKIATLNLANTNYQKLQPDLALLDLALPTNSLPTSFLGQIETLIATHQLSLTSLSLGDIYLVGIPLKTPSPQDSTTTLPPDTESVNFTITVQGSYSNLKSFLQDMQNLKRLSLITDFNFRQLTQTQSEPSTDLLSLSVSGQIPFFAGKP